MHGPLICAVFAICIYLQSVVSRTACEYEVRRKNATVTSENESPYEGCKKQCSPSWLDIGKLDVERTANSAVNWMRNVWNSEVKLKFRILRNEENDTLLIVQFKNVDPTTDTNSESKEW